MAETAHCTFWPQAEPSHHSVDVQVCHSAPLGPGSHSSERFDFVITMF